MALRERRRSSGYWTGCGRNDRNDRHLDILNMEKFQQWKEGITKGKDPVIMDREELKDIKII